MHHCWINGTINKVSESNIPIFDLGLMRGYGLFDYFRTYNLKPFQWDWYWERYENSARMLKIANPVSKDEARKIVEELIAKQGENECAIRFLLTGGYAEDSISSQKPTLIICSEDIHFVKEEEYETGIKIISHQYTRDFPAIKSTDYKRFMFLRDEIKSQNASDVLYIENGEISELSRSNIFLIKGNKLITPNKNILFGITRRTVLELAQGIFEIEERRVEYTEVIDADEVFTTSSTKRVLPITNIDGVTIGENKIGPKTAILLGKINELVGNWG